MSNAAPAWEHIRAADNIRQHQNGTGHISSFAIIWVGTSGHLVGQNVLPRIGWTGSGLTRKQLQPCNQESENLSLYLETTRSALRLSVSDLARMFGVSRPTIYDWQKGRASREKHAARVKAVAQAVAPHTQFLAGHSGRTAHRAISGRNTLLGLLSNGANPDNTMKTLVDVLKKEDEQREKLARRLEGKTIPRGHADVDTFG